MARVDNAYNALTKAADGTQTAFGNSAALTAAGAGCSGLMKPDTHLGENARHIEVSDDQATSCLFR